MEHVDFWTLIAKKRGAPDGWRWNNLEVIGERPHHAFRLRGGITQPYKSGKRVGQPNWKGRDKSHDRDYLITPADLDAMKLEWEADTGKCSTCFGVGKRSKGWSATTGRILGDCERCGATGAAP